MSENYHIVISGERGVGKSTLIQRLLEHNSKPLYGFVTQKMQPDEDGNSHVYINPINNNDRKYSIENRVGTCNSEHSTGYPIIFDNIGVKLLQYDESCLLVMDELGFMENEAAAFQKAVLEALDNQKISILAAVKSRDTRFLEMVKNHPKVMHYRVTCENREALFNEIVSIIN